MRLFAVVLCSLVAATASAKPAKRASHHANKKASRSAHTDDVTTHRHALVKPHASHVRAPYVIRGPIEGQSLGQPWQGKLHEATELPPGDGYVIRRPYRAFGTRTTVEFVHHALTDMREQFPDTHELAVGDISQEPGGQITQHRSHQSGRDVDIGLVYKHKPASFPQDFVTATADNLDCEATYALLNEFAETAHEDGGAQMIFLDYNVQGLLYHWAKDHGEDDSILEHLFQYPNRGSSSSLVRHIANHDNHMHVRFKCPSGDTRCSN
ncbi:MAG: penicillin-insensitive murein endopeptidase [Kofleriaceae bacterium]